MGAQGTAILNFGIYPGGSDATVAVAAPNIEADSLVEAWLTPQATADHTADEHLIEPLRVMARNVVAGVGFTIAGVNTSQLAAPGQVAPTIWGQWAVAWVWN